MILIVRGHINGKVGMYATLSEWKIFGPDLAKLFSAKLGGVGIARCGNCSAAFDINGQNGPAKIEAGKQGAPG
jgi:hypothetical protein